MRTHDMVKAAPATARVLAPCASLEMWGGATFDVALRFLHEDPWKRLELLRAKVPDIPFQVCPECGPEATQSNDACTCSCMLVWCVHTDPAHGFYQCMQRARPLGMNLMYTGEGQTCALSVQDELKPLVDCQ